MNKENYYKEYYGIEIDESKRLTNWSEMNEKTIKTNCMKKYYFDNETEYNCELNLIVFTDGSFIEFTTATDGDEATLQILSSPIIWEYLEE